MRLKSFIFIILALFLIFIIFFRQETGTLRLLITDELTQTEITRLEITISNIQVRSAGLFKNWIPVVKSRKTFDLIKIKDVEEFLGSISLSVGKYDKINFNLDDAYLEINQKSEKVKIEEKTVEIEKSFEIKKGETTTIIMDLNPEDILQKANGFYVVNPSTTVTKEEKCFTLNGLSDGSTEKELVFIKSEEKTIYLGISKSAEVSEAVLDLTGIKSEKNLAANKPLWNNRPITESACIRGAGTCSEWACWCMNDNDFNTRGYAGGLQNYQIIDIGGSYKIEKLRIEHYSGGFNVHYQIEGSLNGNFAGEQVTLVPHGSYPVDYTFTTSPTAARYIKFMFKEAEPYGPPRYNDVSYFELQVLKESYPGPLSFSVDEKSLWGSKELSDTRTMQDFSKEINSYLKMCTEESCLVPLKISSANGIVEVSNINVVYCL